MVDGAALSAVLRRSGGTFGVDTFHGSWRGISAGNSCASGAVSTPNQAKTAMENVCQDDGALVSQ